jgi:hypothetical protein
MKSKAAFLIEEMEKTNKNEIRVGDSVSYKGQTQKVTGILIPKFPESFLQKYGALLGASTVTGIGVGAGALLSLLLIGFVHLPILVAATAGTLIGSNFKEPFQKEIDKRKLQELKNAIKKDKERVDQYSSTVNSAFWKQVRKSEVVLELDGKDYVTGRSIAPLK